MNVKGKIVTNYILIILKFCKDENGKMFSADIEFAEIYKTGIRNVLTRICGFDEKRDIQLIEEAEKMDKGIDFL